MPDENPPKQGGRRRENMSKDEEATFLTPFVDKAAAGGILVVTEIRQALEAYLGRKVALASVYNLLHRHGWRKLAPDKRHHKADVEAQDDWKKNSQISSRRSAGSGREKAKSGECFKMRPGLDGFPIPGDAGAPNRQGRFARP